MTAVGDQEKDRPNMQLIHQPGVGFTQAFWFSFLPSNLELIYTWESTLTAVNYMAD